MPLRDYHGSFDLGVYRLLNRDGGALLDAVMRLLSAPAFGVLFWLACALLLWAAARRAATRPLLAMGLAILGSDLVGARLLRPLSGRMRPCYALEPGSFRWLAPAANAPSLPSLHASNFFALALVATLARPALAVVVYPIAFGVALSRVYVGVHWPTDVLAGMAWGTLAGAAAWAIAGALAAPRAARPPPAQPAPR